MMSTKTATMSNLVSMAVGMELNAAIIPAIIIPRAATSALNPDSGPRWQCWWGCCCSPSWGCGRLARPKRVPQTSHSSMPAARLGPFALTSNGGVNPAELQDAPVIVKGTCSSPRRSFMWTTARRTMLPVSMSSRHCVLKAVTTRVLVNRGWVAWPGGSRKALPHRANTRRAWWPLEGIATVPVNKRFLLMPEHAESLPRLWPRLRPRAIHCGAALSRGAAGAVADLSR